MFKDKRYGLALIVLGVAANNYVYLHDLILNKHDGLIYLGQKGWLGVVVTLVIIIAGLGLVLRSREEGEP